MPIRRLFLRVALCGLPLLSACQFLGTSAAGEGAEELDPRSFPVLDGSSGERLEWAAFIELAADHDVVILGELHDDGPAHAVQLAVTQDLGARGLPLALALEMLERDEQHLVDDYLDGLIDGATLARLTHSESWAGPGSWARWYQPILDAARDADGAVIAANAPRRYVRLARLEGFERLEALPEDRRRFVEWPESLPLESRYRERFWELSDATEEDDERLLPVFRSQLTWDATMADSVARALRAGHAPVILLIGQFHSDFEGGTVLELRHRAPDARILAVSMQPTTAETLRPEDEGRAHVLIHTPDRERKGRRESSRGRDHEPHR